MNSEVSAVIEQFRAAIEQAANLKQQIRNAYDKLETTEDKFLFVLNLGFDFLDRDHCYCPHLSLDDGTEITMYDDFYWERYETKELDDFYDELYQSKTGKYLGGKELVAALMADHIGFLNQDTPASLVIRDLLENGTGVARYDW